MKSSQLEPLPISKAQLERFRINSRYQKRPSLIGGHQMRRKGQSLEFYDYRPYIPGDDIRHVDWRASSRYGGSKDLLVRTFTAEEHLTLLISLDFRESMSLPQNMPKNLIAAWLTEAISWIALRSGDRVILHNLFCHNNLNIRELHGTHHLNSIPTIIQHFYSSPKTHSSLSLSGLEKHLKPSVVWIIISDFYFDLDTVGKKLGHRIARAQDGMRWIILVDTDSWPLEKQLLGKGPRKIEGPDLPHTSQPLEIKENTLSTIEDRISRHKQYFNKQINRDAFDFICWKWPSDEILNPKSFFERQFSQDRVIQRLFMKEY